MSAPFVPALDTFVGGQMTDLPAYTGGLDLTALLEIVSPGNASQGVNYSISIQQFIDVFLPAFVDFFNTSETLTTGAVPVTINPLVYLTKIISGGTGGTEIVIYPDRDNSRAGIPHAIEFITHTNPSDVIQLYGQPSNTNPIQGSPMGPLGPLTANSLLTLNVVLDGFTTTWGSNGAWIINGIVGASTATFPNADNPGIPIVYGRNAAGAYGDYHDVTNPAFTINITSSTNSGAPTSDTAVAYATGIVSTGSAGDEFIALASPPAPGSLFGDAGIRHVIYFKTRTNPSDFVDLNLANIRNSDGTTFTSVQFLAPNDFMLLQWHPQDSTWRIIDGSATTSPVIVVPGTGGADYFSTSETLTTGASPVNIDPAVFHTKIISGGTAGTEFINFPDYTPDQSGKPHLVTLITQTNPSDVIQLSGDTNIIGSPFNGAIIPGDTSLFQATTLEMNAVDQGFVLTWTDFAWCVTELVQEPVAVYPLASQSSDSSDAPSVMFQDADGTYSMLPDASNPQFGVIVTASSDINNPTVIPGTVHYVQVRSTGLSGAGYITLSEQPSSANGNGGGITKVIQGHIVAGGDTILVDTTSIKNADLTLFTAFPLDNQILQCHWDITAGWVADRLSITFTTTSPFLRSPLYGASPPYIQSAGGAVVVDTGFNYTLFSASGGGTYSLPTPIASGNRYSFGCDGSGLVTVQLPSATTVQGGGITSSAAGTLFTNQLGAMVTVRDVTNATYAVESIVGNWTIT